MRFLGLSSRNLLVQTRRDSSHVELCLNVIIEDARLKSECCLRGVSRERSYMLHERFSTTSAGLIMWLYTREDMWLLLLVYVSHQNIGGEVSCRGCVPILNWVPITAFNSGYLPRVFGSQYLVSHPTHGFQVFPFCFQLQPEIVLLSQVCHEQCSWLDDCQHLSNLAKLTEELNMCMKY